MKRRRRREVGRASRAWWRPLARGLRGSLWGRRLGHERGNGYDKGVRVCMDCQWVFNNQISEERQKGWGTNARMKLIAIIERSLRAAADTGAVASSGSFGSAFESSGLRPGKLAGIVGSVAARA